MNYRGVRKCFSPYKEQMMSTRSGVTIFLLVITVLFGALYLGAEKLQAVIIAGDSLLVRTESPNCDCAIVVNYSDAWAYGPHAVSIYREKKGKLRYIQETKIANDGVIPDEKNYETEWDGSTLRLILKGDEQAEDTLFIQCDE